jgi:hypothetical protein
MQVICRDRAGAYAEEACTGAPQAIRVADRWHLWHNLAEALEATVIRHRAELTEPCPPDDDANSLGSHGFVPTDPRRVPVAERPETLIVRRTRERHTAIRQLRGEGRSISAISRTSRLDRHTVRRFAKR